MTCSTPPSMPRPPRPACSTFRAGSAPVASADPATDRPDPEDPSPEVIHQKPWELPGSDGATIFGVAHHPQLAPPHATPRGCVILCHGFKGYMDYGFLPRLADAIARRGFETHRFNFSHSGVSRQHETFSYPNRFERDTWDRQVFDLQKVITTHGRPHSRPVGIFGHSRGGVTALLASSRLRDAITAIVTAASPADACRLDEDQRRQLRRDDRLASPSSRTGQTLYVGRAWLDEIEADPQAHDPLRAAARFPGHLLQVHGRDDATVPLHDLHRYAAANPRSQTRIIDHANHVFNASNPLPEDAPLPEVTAQLFDATTDFFRETLKPPPPDGR